MKIDMHVVRKIVIGVFLSMALMAELPRLATATSAQDYASDPASASPPISAGSPINSAASGTSNLPIGTVNPSQAPPNASILAVPVVGNAPLTVDFFIGLASTPGSFLYEWNFGDGAEAFLPAEPYMLHVYQNPGSYICELELVTPRGISTTAFTKITVKPRQG
jgi:PKD repeat protein